MASASWQQKGCLLTLKIIANDLKQIESIPRGIGLGFFDGVHIGHRELIQTLVHECRRIGCRPSIYTFAEHPGVVLHQDKPFSEYLSTLDDRLALLHGCGVEEVCLQHFDEHYAAIEAEEFLDFVLDKTLGTCLVVVGPDYRFGRAARGDVSLLQAWADRKGIQVIIVPEIELYGQKVSSTAIRASIDSGNLPLASSMLGRPFSISGAVQYGQGLGRTLGFPTANINVPAGLVCPDYGVYATRTTVDGRTYESVTNIGVRPTVDTGDQQPLIETCLLDVDIQLYGRRIEVHFLELMRPELKFDSILELSNRVHQDLEDARNWHRDAEKPYVVLKRRQATLSIVRTRRFVQAGAEIAFRLPMEAKRNARIALLLRILTSGCRRLPDRKSLAFALDAQYGSSIDHHVERQGDIMQASLMADGLMHWSDGTSPFRDTVSLLFEILLDPLRGPDGRFDDRTVATERQNLIMEIRARENDRAQYALDRGLEEYCSDKAHGLPANGRAEDVLTVTDADLQTAYRELLEMAELSIDVGGDIDPATLEHVIGLVERLPDARTRMELIPAQWPTPFAASGMREVTETRDVEQARIVLFFDGLPPYCSLSGFTSAMLNSILGGDVHSLLFETVREKLGLAYSVYSMPLRYLSSAVMMAGVRPDQVTEATAAMVAQVERIRDGQYDARVFESAHTMIEHSIRSRNDDLARMLQQISLARSIGRDLSLEDSLSLLASVTPEQVASMAGRMQLRGSFVLTAPADAVSAETGADDREEDPTVTAD